MSDAVSQAAGNTQATGSAQPDAGATGASGAAAAPAAAAPASSAAPAPSSQQVTEGQTAGDKPAAGTEGQTQQTAKTAAPERYEFKAPEGVVLDDTAVAEFSTVAKELGLPQDAAQKVIDKLAPKLAESNAKAMTTAIQNAGAEWAKATQADAEIGGEKLKENLAVAQKALERFGTPELRALLSTFDPKGNPKGTGLGNHPDVIRLFYRIGKAISEDRPVNGTTQPAKGARDAASALYPNQKA